MDKKQKQSLVIGSIIFLITSIYLWNFTLKSDNSKALLLLPVFYLGVVVIVASIVFEKLINKIKNSIDFKSKRNNILYFILFLAIFSFLIIMILTTMKSFIK